MLKYNYLIVVMSAIENVQRMLSKGLHLVDPDEEYRGIWDHLEKARQECKAELDKERKEGMNRHV